MRAICLVPIFCLLPGISGARDSDNCEAAKKVVAQYVALDLRGEGTHSSRKMAALIDFQGRDTPGWDSFVLTSESEIESCDETGSRIDVIVRHKVFGTVHADEHAAISQMLLRPVVEEKTRLRLHKTPQGWKIDSPTVYVPHVAVTAAKKIFSVP